MGFGFGWHYPRRGEVKHGFKYAAIASRTLLQYVRDLARLRSLFVLGRPLAR